MTIRCVSFGISFPTHKTTFTLLPAFLSRCCLYILQCTALSIIYIGMRKRVCSLRPMKQYTHEAAPAWLRGGFVRRVVLKWTRRELNPRPNEEIECFLHAYHRLHFRAAARPVPPTATLSSASFALPVRPGRTISDFAAPPCQEASEQERLGDVSFQHLVSE